MSNREFGVLLVRLYRDRAFREAQRRDAQTALADYDLTPKQREARCRLQRHPKSQPTPFEMGLPSTGYSFSLN
ncbi:MAG: hypothetical protein R2873_27580 [Caldilineaceae bacterium]